MTRALLSVNRGGALRSILELKAGLERSDNLRETRRCLRRGRCSDNQGSIPATGKRRNNYNLRRIDPYLTGDLLRDLVSCHLDRIVSAGNSRTMRFDHKASPAARVSLYPLPIDELVLATEFNDSTVVPKLSIRRQVADARCPIRKIVSGRLDFCKLDRTPRRRFHLTNQDVEQLIGGSNTHSAFLSCAAGPSHGKTEAKPRESFRCAAREGREPIALVADQSGGAA